jgi:hypothetical protein
MQVLDAILKGGLIRGPVSLANGNHVLALPRDRERIAISCYTGHQIGFPNLATLALVARRWMKLKGDMNIALLDHEPSQRNIPQIRRLKRQDPGAANIFESF